MYRLALVFLVLSGPVLANVTAKWEVEVLHPDKEVKRYAPLESEFQINTGRSSWKCNLGKASTVKENSIKVATRNIICESGDNTVSITVQCINSGVPDADLFGSREQSLTLATKGLVHQISTKCSIL